MEQKLLGDAKAVIEAAINGLRALEKEHYQMNETVKMKECKEDFIGQYNNFAIFADLYIVKNTANKITSQEIEKAYRNFFLQHNYIEVPVTTWGQWLKQKYSCKSITMTISDSMKNAKSRARGYQGIALLPDEVALTDEDNDMIFKPQRRS